jgi:hypothetical protein
MAVAASRHITPEAVTSPWRGFKAGLWQKEIRWADLNGRNSDLTTPSTIFSRQVTKRLNRRVRSSVTKDSKHSELEPALAV